MGDIILLNWAFENIIKNSLDATNYKNSIIDINIFKSNNSIIIDISDNGKGIVRNKWKKIFEPGFSSKKRGWGLGLSLTKRIIEDLHNGKINVISAKPGLTLFRIQFDIVR
jgi:signal transduction histidine kinase